MLVPTAQLAVSQDLEAKLPLWQSFRINITCNKSDDMKQL